MRDWLNKAWEMAGDWIVLLMTFAFALLIFYAIYSPPSQPPPCDAQCRAKQEQEAEFRDTSEKKGIEYGVECREAGGSLEQCEGQAKEAAHTLGPWDEEFFGFGVVEGWDCRDAGKEFTKDFCLLKHAYDEAQPEPE